MRRRVYALSLQGGGVAVLYLTAYSAFALFDLLPAAAAFGFLLIFTIAGGMLSVLQDSRWASFSPSESAVFGVIRDIRPNILRRPSLSWFCLC